MPLLRLFKINFLIYIGTQLLISFIASIVSTIINLDFIFGLLFLQTFLFTLYICYNYKYSFQISIPKIKIIIFLIAISIGAIGLSQLVASYLGEFENTAAVTMLENAKGIDLIFLGSFTIFFVPLIEEFLFRRLLFQGIKDMNKRSLAYFVSAILFAIIHFNVALFLIYFLLGCIFAYVYERYNNIWAPIFIHCFFNMFSFLGIIFNYI